MLFLKRIPLFMLPFALATIGLADGPADNIPENVRRVPPLGIEVPDETRQALEAGIAELQAEMTGFKHELLPDVEIFIKAVDDSLRFQEFQKENELKTAQQLLVFAKERLAHLKAGEAPWTRETGLVVRGFRSKLDGTAQPYGLVIPESYEFTGAREHRLDFWFHGRGERTNEVSFIQGRLSNAGQFQPKDTIVLHPYARFSNGNKFAGEIDCLEALEHAQANYRIDENRILVRGFSMGGAATWNFAAHYADRWAAANPGAGYSETPDFLRTFQGETLNPAWYQRKLWHMHDCTDYAINFFNLPTVAYSGENDTQKQAADIMALAMAEEGLKLTHIIGPDTAHKIHPDSKIEIERRLDSIAKVGRNPMPERVRFTTWTLRYNRMHWVTIDRMGEHWERARLDADIANPVRIDVWKVDNVTAFTFDMPAGLCPLDPFVQPIISIGAQEIEGPPVGSDRSWTAHLHLDGEEWKLVEHEGGEPAGLAKKHGLQGPIDDAFLDSFLFVKPTGKPRYDNGGEFVHREFTHAVEHWRQQMRGHARVKDDRDVTDEDIANHNLILWGDHSSNQLIAKILQQLPVSWDDEAITIGEQKFDSKHHALLMIYPNPLNPERYVVLNSSFTYREYDYLNNARQVSKLPDWAVVDVRTPMTSQGPGEVVAADFFGEKWEVRPADQSRETAINGAIEELHELDGQALLNRGWKHPQDAVEFAERLAQARKSNSDDLPQILRFEEEFEARARRLDAIYARMDSLRELINLLRDEIDPGAQASITQ
ncbi:MAG: hypothetical protein ACI8UO_001860 [Verrucomicrobiales bacterium]|jgi:hypothetical protein